MSTESQSYMNAELKMRAMPEPTAELEVDARECSLSNPDPRPMVYRLMVEYTKGFVKVGDFATHEEAEASLTVTLAKRMGRRYSINAVAAR